MPKLIPTVLSARYIEVAKASASVSEANDCAVKALSLATGTDYATTRAIFAELGRESGRATPNEITRAAISRLGYKIVRILGYRAIPELGIDAGISELIATYPGSHSNAVRITSHHPRRYSAYWGFASNLRILAISRNHIFAIVNGETLDYSKNRSFRIEEMWVIEPVEPETVEPETVEPETVEPETVEPETVETPETVEPETVEPETVETPETVEPETVEPETVETPETVEPETVEPETVEPETVEPVRKRNRKNRR